jgi:hypothetical protein
MREQHPDRDAVDQTVGVVDLSQLGHPAGDPVVQRQEPAIAELEHGDGGQGLGDGGPVIDGPLVHLPSGGAIGEAVMMPLDDGAVSDQHRTAPDDPRGLREGVEPAAQLGPSSLCLRRGSQAGEQGREEKQKRLPANDAPGAVECPRRQGQRE